MRLPRFDATTAPTGTGLVRADPRAQTDVGDAQFRGLQAFGGAIQGVGGVAAKAAKARQALDDQAAMGEINKRAIDALNEGIGTYRNFDPLVGNTTPLNPKDYYDGQKAVNFNVPKKIEFRDLTQKGFEEKIDSLAKVIKDPKRQQSWKNSQKINAFGVFTELGNEKLQELHEALIIGNATNAAENGDIETSNEWIDIAEKHGLIGPKRAAAERDKNEALMVRAVIENIKPDLIAAIEENNDKKDGLAVLDSRLSELTENGILTAAEGADADKVLGDWIDSFVQGRIKQAKETQNAITRSSYQDLSGQIVGGSLSFDDIGNSNLLKVDKELWQGYIMGSYKDSPTENTPKGHDISFNAVFDVATLQISPKDGYDALLQARFTDRTITDEQFEWGVDKIENPYSKDTLENLNMVTNSNLQDFNRWLSRDKARNQNVNESLVAWVDQQIEDGKMPTKKEMYAMSSQFRVGDDRWYDMGQVIERGGKDWEIVGFDEDGEPVVEEVR